MSMNDVRTVPMPLIWHNPFARLKKTVLSHIAYIEDFFEDVMPVATIIGAIIIAFSGILDLSFFQELFSGLLSGSPDSGFFKSLPLNHF